MTVIDNVMTGLAGFFLAFGGILAVAFLAGAVIDWWGKR